MAARSMCHPAAMLEDWLRPAFLSGRLPSTPYAQLRWLCQTPTGWTGELQDKSFTVAVVADAACWFKYEPAATNGGIPGMYVQLRSYTLLRQPEPTLHIHKMFGYASSAGADRHETRLIDSRLLGRWEEEQGGQGLMSSMSVWSQDDFHGSIPFEDLMGSTEASQFIPSRSPSRHPPVVRQDVAGSPPFSPQPHALPAPQRPSPPDSVTDRAHSPDVLQSMDQDSPAQLSQDVLMGAAAGSEESGSLGIPGNQEDYFAAMPDDGAGYHPDGDAQGGPRSPRGGLIRPAAALAQAASGAVVHVTATPTPPAAVAPAHSAAATPPVPESDAPTSSPEAPGTLSLLSSRSESLPASTATECPSSCLTFASSPPNLPATHPSPGPIHVPPAAPSRPEHSPPPPPGGEKRRRPDGEGRWANPPPGYGRLSLQAAVTATLLAHLQRQQGWTDFISVLDLVAERHPFTTETLDAIYHFVKDKCLTAEGRPGQPMLILQPRHLPPDSAGRADPAPHGPPAPTAAAAGSGTGPASMEVDAVDTPQSSMAPRLPAADVRSPGPSQTPSGTPPGLVPSQPPPSQVVSDSSGSQASASSNSSPLWHSPPHPIRPAGHLSAPTSNRYHPYASLAEYLRANDRLLPPGPEFYLAAATPEKGPSAPPPALTDETGDSGRHHTAEALVSAATQGAANLRSPVGGLPGDPAADVDSTQLDLWIQHHVEVQQLDEALLPTRSPQNRRRLVPLRRRGLARFAGRQEPPPSARDASPAAPAAPADVPAPPPCAAAVSDAPRADPRERWLWFLNFRPVLPPT